MFASFIRIVIGFVLACLVAGLTKVLFAFSPMELSGLPPDVASDRISMALPVAVHTALFAAPFALLAAIVGEMRHWRDWAYYATVGVALALLGFVAQYSNESATQSWSVANSNYPLVTFLTTGFMGGLTYWLVSGRHAGGHPPAKPAATMAKPSATRPGSGSGTSGRSTSTGKA